MRVDLHIHTTASDGRYSTAQIIEAARQAKLAIIAITDHDTCEGLVDINPSQLQDLRVLTGIEFSTDLPQYEVHILGYNFDRFNQQLVEKLQQLVAGRQQRASRMVKCCRDQGYNIVFDDIDSTTIIGRPHVAQLLVAAGYFASVKEAFQKLLFKNGPAYIPHFKFPVVEIIALIKQAGGKAVLAHPGLIGDEQVVEWVVGLGIDGIEAVYPRHSLGQEMHYRQLADRNNLLVTGGSDFHGIKGRYPEKLGEFFYDCKYCELG